MVIMPPLRRLKPPDPPPAAPAVPVHWRITAAADALRTLAPEIPADRLEEVARELVRRMHTARKPAPPDNVPRYSADEPRFRLYDDGKRTLEIRPDPFRGYVWRWTTEREWKHAQTITAAHVAARLPARYRRYFVEPA